MLPDPNRPRAPPTIYVPVPPAESRGAPPPGPAAGAARTHTLCRCRPCPAPPAAGRPCTPLAGAAAPSWMLKCKEPPGSVKIRKIREREKPPPRDSGWPNMASHIAQRPRPTALRWGSDDPAWLGRVVQPRDGDGRCGGAARRPPNVQAGATRRGWPGPQRHPVGRAGEAQSGLCGDSRRAPAGQAAPQCSRRGASERGRPAPRAGPTSAVMPTPGGRYCHCCRAGRRRGALGPCLQPQERPLAAVQAAARGRLEAAPRAPPPPLGLPPARRGAARAAPSERPPWLLQPRRGRGGWGRVRKGGRRRVHVSKVPHSVEAEPKAAGPVCLVSPLLPLCVT
jgi:hypothetical protein